MITKNILLAGIAAGAMALVASTADAYVVQYNTSGTGINAQMTLAKEANFVADTAAYSSTSAATAANDGQLNIKIAPNDGTRTAAAARTLGPASTTGVLTITLSGGAIFPRQVATSDFSGAGTVTYSSGGAAGSNTVTFFLTGMDAITTGSTTGATAAAPLIATLPIRLQATATGVVVSTTLQTTTGQGIDGGAASLSNGTSTTAPTSASVVALNIGNAFSVTAVPVSAANTPTASIASSYKLFKGSPDSSSVTLGTAVNVALAPAATGFTVERTLGGGYTGSPVVPAAGDVLGAKITFSAGDFTNATLKTANANAVTTAGVTTLTLATADLTALNASTAALAAGTTLTVSNVTPANATTPNTLAPTTYTGSLALTLASASSSYANQTYSPQTFGSIVLEGTNITAPWVGDGTNNYVNFIRISNLGGPAVATVTASLVNPVVTGTSGTVASTAPCSVGPLPANGELTVSSTTLQTCFGSFGRSDVRITLQAGSTNLSAKMRILNGTSSGVVTEQSLGTGQGSTFGVVGASSAAIQ